MIHPEAEYSLLRFAFTRHPFIFLFIHGLTIGANAVLPFTDQWHWMVPVMGIAVECIYWIGSWQHRKRLRKLNATPGNFHYPEVCEGCDPVCFNDGKPIDLLPWWYAAVHDITREAARKQLNDMDVKAYVAQRKLFRKYLEHPKFDKFRS